MSQATQQLTIETSLKRNRYPHAAQQSVRKNCSQCRNTTLAAHEIKLAT